MKALFTGEPAGVLVIPSLAEAMEQITDLRQRVEELETRLEKTQPHRGGGSQ